MIRLGLPDAGLKACEAQLTGLLKLHCDGFDACKVPWQRASQVPLTASAAAAKRSAIGAFASQLTGRPAGGPVVPPRIMAHFTRSQEVFLR